MSLQTTVFEAWAHDEVPTAADHFDGVACPDEFAAYCGAYATMLAVTASADADTIDAVLAVRDAVLCGEMAVDDAIGAVATAVG